MLKLDLVLSKMKLLKMSSASDELEQILRSMEECSGSYLDFISQILDIEIRAREINNIKRKIRQAGFPIVKTISDFDFSFRPELNKHTIMSFCDGSFLDRKENLIFVGNPGTGKTHLSLAIAYEMCQKNKSVLFTTATSLINSMNEARDEKVLARFLKQANKLDLVVIDEIGYLPYEKNESEMLFNFISERYERGSIIITTNLPFSKWNEIFHTERLTTAILDRIIHHCHIIELNGESYRFSESLKNKGGKRNKNKKVDN
jgi:DNA replication protein DnaC